MSAKYRPDIDGLRAVAVIPVVLFHSKISLFGGNLFPGGFVGVDIFFVISGYLISTILLGDITSNKFSILKFYERRIRRIFPALFAVLLITSCVALVILLPEELDRFGHDLFATTFFYSNYYSMSFVEISKGYFSPDTETNPLLHMWSLAVEEQFYIIFPIYLYFASRFFRKKLGVITAVLMLISLAYSIAYADSNPEEAFYSTPARAWELMLGAMLAILPRNTAMEPRLANTLAATGLGFITYAILFFSNMTAFPGAAALIPCIGAALIIYAGQANMTVTKRFLSTGAFRYPGLISYSLYLWHWPILVFYKMYAITPVTPLETALLLALMGAIAWASWKFVEAPFRTRSLFPQRYALFAFGGGVMLVSAACGAIFAIANGFPNRLPGQVKQIFEAKNDTSYSYFADCETIIPADAGKARLATSFCPIGSTRPGPATFAVWGDSHAEMFTIGIDAAAKRAGAKGILLYRPSCPPLIGLERITKGIAGCPDSAKAAMAYLNEHHAITQIFVIARWTSYWKNVRFENNPAQHSNAKDIAAKTVSLSEGERAFKWSLERTLASLSGLGAQLTIVMQAPVPALYIPQAAARMVMLGRNKEIRPSLQRHVGRQKFFTTALEELTSKYNFTLVQPSKAMCGENYCDVLDEGIPVFFDNDHITKSHALKLSYLFEPFFVKLTEKSKLSTQTNADNPARTKTK